MPDLLLVAAVSLLRPGGERRPDRRRNRRWLASGYLLLMKSGRPGGCQLSVWSPSRKARRHLLKKPAVAVRIAERGKRAVGLVLWGRARSACLGAGVMEHPAGVMEHLAHLDTTVDQLGPGRLDIGDDELQTFSRARCGRGDPAAEDDPVSFGTITCGRPEAGRSCRASSGRGTRLVRRLSRRSFFRAWLSR